VDFDPTLKKKKKKKVVLEDEDGVEAATGDMDGLNVDDEGFGEKKKKKKSKDKDADADEDFGKKKKKKKKKDMDDEDDEDDDADEATNSGSGLPWDGSNREYHYDELLGRVFGILREKNPSLSEKTKTIIKPPQVLREGTKKTVFANLIEICNAMNRSPEHVIQYMMAELGTSGTLDGTQRLIIKGRFLPKVFEGVLRHYFIDYVICNLCKSANTTLDRDKATRLSICKCNACGASRSVSAIQKGFQAVQRGERRKARQAA
jgi:translation initiation factor 2 subunit 2